MQYVLECISFQLVFLIIYDLWLKKETFFQWNRAYLIGTYLLSLIVPWIKIEALKVTVPEAYYAFPSFLISSDQLSLETATTGNPVFELSWQEGMYLGGVFLATLFFGYKLLQIYRLRKQGEVHFFQDFTRVVIKNSNMAFSFFKSIFLGDQVLEQEHESIIQHELVHIRQRHSLDLIFFEAMRIIGWFNPLVYVYQNRISELHEFIADAKVAKTHKKEQYQLLLSQVFKTQHISFINQFFKSSLIKKRIVMLTKAKSKKIWRLKYLLLLPLVLGMLCFSSLEGKEQKTIKVENIANLTEEEESRIFEVLTELSKTSDDWELVVKDQDSGLKFVKSADGSYISGPKRQKVFARLAMDSKLEGSLGMKSSKTGLTKNGLSLFENLSYMAFKYNMHVSERKKLIDKGDIENPLIARFDKKIEELNQQMSGGYQRGFFDFNLIEVPPIFPGCENVTDKRSCFTEKIRLHIEENFHYPKEAKENGIIGDVKVKFAVTMYGDIDVLMAIGPDKLLEEEAERIIYLLPEMKPGTYEGEDYNFYFSTTISFGV